jgi:formylglycine-generating enzyme required for sulfatase activity
VGAIIESLQTLDVLPDDQTRLADGLFTAASAALEKQDLPSVVDAVKLVAGLKQVQSGSLPGLKDRLGKVLVAQGDAALADGSLPRVGAIIESLQTLDVLPDDQTRLADGLFTAASAALTAALEKQDLPSVVDAVKLVAGLKQEKRDRAIAVAVTPLSQMLLDGLKGDQPQQAATVLADLAVVMPELATALQDVVKELSDEVKAMLPATLRRLAPPDWLNDGLVAYYPFNGNAKDESGNGNDGEVRGTTPSSDRFDTLNRSYFFDGVNDGIVLPDFKNLNVGPGSFTLNAWVLPRADKGIIIDKYSRKDTRCISLAHNIGDKSKGEVALFLRGLRYEDDLLLNSTQSLNRNAWQLVTAVKNAATSRYSLYVDGQLRSVGNWNGNHHVPAAWNIGMRAVGGADSYFKGSIDDVRIYNLALSADNVKALYGYESLPPLSDSVQAPSSDVAPFDAAQAKAHQQAWADHLGVPVETTNSIGMKFVVIPPGEFMMGSPKGESGRLDHETLHKVTLTKPFQMGMHEVTQEHYQRVMGTTPSTFKGKQNPVEQVNWDEAVAFCGKLAALPAEKSAGYVYRLPTEAEWEYACRAGTTTKYSFGNSDSELGDYAWYDKNSGRTTHPVGGKKPNAWGLYNMHGNVYEWCQDWYGDYASGSVTDPTGAASSSLRVARGGCWINYSVSCRSAHRPRGATDSRFNFLGFRVLRSSIK